MSEQLTFLLEERPVNHSPSPDFGKALMTRAEISCSHLALLQIISDLGGLSGKTCPVSCHRTKDGTLEPSSECWRNSGMGSPTGFWTLNTSEWPSGAAVCLLSDILETGDVPRRYYLSPKACRGILRRAEKRGKKLPEILRLELMKNVMQQ